MSRLLLFLLFAAVSFSGCAQQPLYAWGPFENVISRILQGGYNVNGEILRMEQFGREAAMRGQKLPPGYHAQLGLLYAEAGNEDRMEVEYMQEKDLYPPSGTFMDFLLSNREAGYGK
ncbi:DUF4810 domain-containing protein [Desulforhopalus vacuolatus]|uniref:DUF4810 domain-containing protein n=1 Tax=Desulforhopalus vacuolatus TaxID=40414 RepID=UPI001964FCB8|nr:DUF4810 domain-containing protein [Desulforhopalus vacuolatus]MBM9519151.1 DUF4810 domain-containing protein [Desulforhopalus vacuolatus]